MPHEDGVGQQTQHRPGGAHVAVAVVIVIVIGAGRIGRERHHRRPHHRQFDGAVQGVGVEGFEQKRRRRHLLGAPERRLVVEGGQKDEGRGPQAQQLGGQLDAVGGGIAVGVGVEGQMNVEHQQVGRFGPEQAAGFGRGGGHTQHHVTKPFEAQAQRLRVERVVFHDQ